MNPSRQRILALVASLAVLLPTVQILRVNWHSITRSDAPLSFRPDKRLSMLEPKPEEQVHLPVTVKWDSQDFKVGEDGNQFGVFVDSAIPSPGDYLRVRLCTRLGELPPAPGDFRGICKDQRDSISFTTGHTAKFDCFEPHYNKGKRRMNDHTVTVILLDKDFKRIGEAAANVMFRADPKDAKKCRGFDS